MLGKVIHQPIALSIEKFTSIIDLIDPSLDGEIFDAVIRCLLLEFYSMQENGNRLVDMVKARKIAHRVENHPDFPRAFREIGLLLDSRYADIITGPLRLKVERNLVTVTFLD